MRVLDIGANIGFYSLLAASRVGSDGEVLAVEPNPANVRLIQRSKAKNNFENIRVIQGTAYDTWEPLALFIDSSNGSVGSIGSGTSDVAGRTVMGLPLRAAVGEARLDVVKIDVEGAEGRAMAGMWDVIACWKPVVFSEFTPDSMATMSACQREIICGCLPRSGIAFQSSTSTWA
jgi:FkbM family methyltransferase